MLGCGGVVAVLLFSASGNVYMTASAGTQSGQVNQRREVEEFVEQFGKELRNVRLDVPGVTDRLRTVYSEYVSLELLASWIREPFQAPGQVASSPWPDRIEIEAVSNPTGQTYEVTGRVIELTSWELTHGGVANQIPIRITVQRRDGRLRITQYRRLATSG
jgi:hypothetical protein